VPGINKEQNAQSETPRIEYLAGSADDEHYLLEGETHRSTEEWPGICAILEQSEQCRCLCAQKITEVA
jgi:hypothetical protein